MSQSKPTHRTVELPDPLHADASPMDVAQCSALPVTKRRDLLLQWKEDEEAELRAQGEGMIAKADGDEQPTADSADTLQQVLDALETLPNPEESK